MSRVFRLESALHSASISAASSFKPLWASDSRVTLESAFQSKNSGNDGFAQDLKIFPIFLQSKGPYLTDKLRDHGIAQVKMLQDLLSAGKACVCHCLIQYARQKSPVHLQSTQLLQVRRGFDHRFGVFAQVTAVHVQSFQVGKRFAFGKYFRRFIVQAIMGE